MPLARSDLRIRTDVEVANQSDAGCERPENEDYFLYIEPRDDEEFHSRGRLVLVADGMGGCNGGEVASRLAADMVRDVFLRAKATDEPRDVLIEGFQLAHEAILRMAREERELHGMGTTCCAAILKRGELYYGHVGDSRLYLIRDGQAKPLTEDHSVVARMVKEGKLTPEEAHNHPQKNVLTAALGIEADLVAGDFSPDPLPLVAGDIVLLCTDGLHGLVSDQEMALTMQDQSLTEACRELVARAKVRGGPDNITVQLLKVRSVET